MMHFFFSNTNLLIKFVLLKTKIMIWLIIIFFMVVGGIVSSRLKNKFKKILANTIIKWNDW